MKKLLLLFSLAFLCFSCCNDNGTGTPPGFLKQMTASGFTGVLHYKYSYNEEKLSFVVNENGYERIKYAGNLIVQVDQFDNSNNLLGRQTFQYDGSDRVVSCTELQYTQNTGIRQQVVYNSDGTVGVSTLYGDLNSQTALAFVKLHYFTGGEITKTITNPGGPTEMTTDYVYDNQYSPMKTILGLNKLGVVEVAYQSLSPDFLKGMEHNCTYTADFANSVLLNVINFSLTYNSNDFATDIIPTINTTTVTDVTRYNFMYY